KLGKPPCDPGLYQPTRLCETQDSGQLRSFCKPESLEHGYKDWKRRDSLIKNRVQTCYSLAFNWSPTMYRFPGRFRTIGLSIFALLACALAYSQADSAKPSSATQKKETVYQSQTVLRATTRLVVLDVVALDANGAPILDLKADDFTVLEDGKPQR